MADVAIKSTQQNNLQHTTLSQHARELASLQKISYEINHTIALINILQLIIDETCHTTDAIRGCITLLDNDGTHRPKVYFGWSDEAQVTDHLKHSLAMRKATKKNAPHIHNNMANVLCSEVVIPIHLDGKTIGTLHLAGDIPNLFKSAQLPYLENVVNQSATAIRQTTTFAQQAARLKLSSQIHTHLSGILNPGELMGEMVKLIATAFNYYHIQLFKVDEQSPQTLILQSCAGSANISRKTDALQTTHSINEETAIGWAAQHQKPLMLNNVRHDTRYTKLVYLPQTQSELVIPILGNQTLIGIIDIQHNRRNAFSKADVENMQNLAGQLSIALQNAKLFDDALQREHLASALGNTGLILNATRDPASILTLICTEALNAFQVDSVFLWMVNEQENIAGVAGAGKNVNRFIGMELPLTDAKSLSARVIHNQRAAFINNVSQNLDRVYTGAVEDFDAQAIIAVPLLIGNQSMGAITMIDCKNPRRFDVQDQISITLLANQAALAIENAQLIDRLNKFNEDLESRIDQRTEELRHARDRTDILYNLAKELSSSLNLDRILNNALNLIKQIVPITQGSILLVDDATGYLNYRASIGRLRGLPKKGKLTRYKMGVGLAGKAMENRKPEIVANLQNYPNWIPDKKPMKHHSAMAVPLIAGYEIVGVMMLFHSETDHFQPTHLHFATAAAPIIATAIHNAGLYNLISDQVKRQGELLASVQSEVRKNTAIIEGTADGILLLDAEQNIQLINSLAAKLLGVNAQSVLDQNFSQIAGNHSPNNSKSLNQHIYQLIKNFEAPAPNTEAQTHRLEINNAVILVILTELSITNHMPPGQLVILRDISREAELDRLKDDFVSTVSHELRTPMTSIKGYTDLIASGKVGELSATQQKFIDVIKNNADRLTTLVNDILDISRIDTGNAHTSPQLIKFPPLVAAVITGLEQQITEKDLSVEINFPRTLPPVFAEANRVTQILVNLIGNAVKYTTASDKITISAHTQGDMVQVDVQDTGLGIPEEDMPHIFSRFFRSARDDNSPIDGTGLGLSITKMVVELMGGEIWAESKLNEGSVFSFTLPTKNTTGDLL